VIIEEPEKQLESQGHKEGGGGDDFNGNSTFNFNGNEKDEVID
jgi:hypothetical protein